MSGIRVEWKDLELLERDEDVYLEDEVLRFEAF